MAPLLQHGPKRSGIMPQISSRPQPTKPVPGTASDLDPRQLLSALNAFKKGDFSVRLPEEWTGIAGRVAEAFNQTVETNERLARELERLSQVVGKEGKVNQRASLGDVRGSWADSVQCVNALVTDLVHPTTETARVIGAVAKGDLSQTMALDLDGRPLAGEFLRTARIVNTMVEQLGAFAAEVTRVAREVGTEGKLGGQAQVKGVAGTWKDLTDNVNLMASNLTVPGPEHRRRDHRDRQGRPVQEDHGRREGRDPRAQGHDQHHRRPAAGVRLRGHARGTRGGHRGQARRSGDRARRGGHVEGPDGQRQLHGQQPHEPGPQHRGRDEGGGDRRPLAQDHGRREGRDPGAQGHDQHDGRPAPGVRLGGDARRARGGHGRQAGRPGQRARRRPAPGRTSPTT